MPRNWPRPCLPTPSLNDASRYVTWLTGLAGATALVWFLSLTLWLLVRRASGALQTPLSNVSLWLTAGGAALLAVAIAASMHRVMPSADRGTPRTALAAGLVATLIMLGAAVSLPASGTWGIAGAWAILSVAGCWLMTRPGARGRWDGHSLSDRPGVTASVSMVFDDENASATDCDELPSDIDQQWTRRRDEQGREVIEGTVRATFAAGQRIAHVHLAICPPLGRTPQVDAEPVAGPPTAVSLGAAVPQGIRLDVRRLESIDVADSAVVAFYIQ